ncbi:TRAP transporter substrate-binding protein [Temperatibacter marinus]|uniref:TRAP transporter substrate-binding protein n=1 Tax=Temperatibacter marinus TaxID=1456591 RepID=A0AA52HAE8_9PROT|nr:TRAP transporter substrate-binding protein [Temperatibacter marinus]WND02528.1 TRAP transporter substrate-binding protein [Temperatibacter marinus]
MNSKKNSISRRGLVKGLGLAGAASLVAACSKQEASDCKESAAVLTGKRTLKLVTTWPKNFPGLGTGPQRFADRVTEMTEGRITIKLYAAGELVGALGAFDAVSQGKADLYHGAEYYWQGKAPAFPFFTAVPMGMTTNELNAWIYYGGGQELWDELSARFNVKALLCGNTGTQMGGWFRNEINSIDDFQGLKIRMPGLGGEVFRRLGATPVTKAGGEIFQALSQGNIDATEWVGPWNDLAFGFHSIVKNYYTSGIHEPGAALAVGFNKEIWDSFSKTDQAMIKAAAAEENSMMYAEYNAQNARALRTLVNEHGVKLLQFPDDIRQRLAEESYKVIEEVSQTDDLSKRIYDSYRSAKSDGMYWGEFAEDYFTQSRRDFPEK